MIPETVKIGWRTYTVIQDEHRSGENGGDLLGEIAYEAGKIYLWDKQDEESKRITLLHEIFHGIMYFMGRGDLRRDEHFITALTENFYQVMKDNPALFETCKNCGKKSFFDQVSSLPDCNTCARKNACQHVPEPGQHARINCPLWEEVPV